MSAPSQLVPRRSSHLCIPITHTANAAQRSAARAAVLATVPEIAMAARLAQGVTWRAGEQAIMSAGCIAYEQPCLPDWRLSWLPVWTQWQHATLLPPLQGRQQPQASKSNTAPLTN